MQTRPGSASHVLVKFELEEQLDLASFNIHIRADAGGRR